MFWWLVLVAFHPNLGESVSPFKGKPTGRIGVTRVVRSFEAPPDDVEEPGYILDVSLGPDGSLAVLDGKNHLVYLWNKEGRFETWVGGQGKGPGELGDPNVLTRSQDRVYVYEVVGSITVYTRSVKGFTTKSAQKYFVKKGLPRAFMCLSATDDKVFMARSKGGLENDPLVAEILNPENGEIKEIESLRFNASRPMLTIANMADPKDELMVGSPRLWAARRAAGGFYYGFSENNTLKILDGKGRPGQSLKVKLPKLPVEPEIEVFMNTPIAIVEKSVRDIEGMLNAKINVKTDGYMSYYSQFLEVGNCLLFFISPLGGFQFADYFNRGHCLVYHLEKESVVARGRMILPEDSRLFVTENCLILAAFDDEDRITLKEVELGWVD